MDAVGGVVAGVLTPAQQEAIAHFRAPNVPAQWFVGEPGADGAVEVLALGADFVWSIRVEANGESNSSEAEVGEFSTGVTC